MKKKEFFARWKEDWENRKEDFSSRQAELFREIRDRQNLEIRLERRMEKVMKELSRSVAEEVYPLKVYE